MGSWLDHPERLSFFQLVRELERAAARSDGLRPVGLDGRPEFECVRFRVSPSRGFPASEVRALRAADGGAGRRDMEIRFLGFVGVAGVLPQHYSDFAVRRRHERDEAFLDWLDVFHHRLISLFHRAWVKYRFPFSYERARYSGGVDDLFTRALRSFAGRGLESIRARAPELGRSVAFASGYYARAVRSAKALESLVADLFQVPVEVEEFDGRWLEIEPVDRTVLLGRPRRGDPAAQLGQGATLGSRVWDVASRIRLRIGPVSRERFLRLHAAAGSEVGLAAVIRDYLGLEIDFRLSFVLAKGASPGIRLGGIPGAEPARLGRDAFLEQLGAAPGERMALV